MALDDLMETEVGVALVATAAAVSPRARNVLRRGAVYGLAGAMKAGDVVYGAARGVVRGAASSVSGSNSSAPQRSASSPRRTTAKRTNSTAKRTSRSRARNA